AGTSVDLGKVDVVKLGDGKRCQPDVGDMHEGIKPRPRLRRDMPAERGEVVGAGVARRHAGGGALMSNELVRRNADRGAVGIDVSVQVNESRRYQLAAGVEHALRPRCWNLRLQRLY